MHTKFLDENMEDVIKLIKNTDVNLDLTIFLGTNHTKLLKILNSRTNIFKLPLTTLILKSEMEYIEDLRLDNSVVAIDEFRES